MRRIRLETPAAVLALLAFICPSATDGQTTATPGCTVPILYDSGGRIFQVEPGRAPGVLAHLDVPDRSLSKPHRSPDGRMIAWVRHIPTDQDGPAIWLMTAGGQEPRPLVPGMTGDQPAWSPDGSRIAFASAVEGNLDIFVVDLDGTDLRRLTRHEATDEYPSWSPDGDQIAFGSLRTGDFEIFVVDTTGSGPRRLTSHRAADFRPSWSPDGEWIAFSSSRASDEAVRTYNYDIYLMRPDGSDVRQLTSHSLLALRPSWSPTGDQLAYQVGGADPDEADWEIYSVEVESGRTHRLTNNQVGDAHPDWNTFHAGCR